MNPCAPAYVASRVQHCQPTAAAILHGQAPRALETVTQEKQVRRSVQHKAGHGVKNALPVKNQDATRIHTGGVTHAVAIYEPRCKLRPAKKKNQTTGCRVGAKKQKQSARRLFSPDR